MSRNSEVSKLWLLASFDMDYQDECIDQLSTFGDEASSFAIMKCWFNDFNRKSRWSHEISYVPENIDVKDCHMTYCGIGEIVGISSTCICKILQEYLTVKKVYPRWIAHNLTKS